ncbi:uncharacterized protein LOC133884619 [Phragmites australis]|uniref:uncharacterized protein LOC133884619 n=1 Tax=Phragmites australis TaxID=29695 RepID=UPI002D77271C|nr:uncharacterized protein LOC133884619 [Phragmites australis]
MGLLYHSMQELSGYELESDLNKFVETCRNDESLVKKKHWQEAYTIFRLLLKQGCPAETDEITDRTILDKQIIHGALYKLWKDEYIDSERVNSATGTGNTQFFVWRVKNTFREQFIDHLYHAALNLHQMFNYMAELLLEGSKDETKLRNRKNILILALTRHDESLMLFHYFLEHWNRCWSVLNVNIGLCKLR